MKRRGLAFLLSASMLLTQGAVMPVLARAEEPVQKRVLMYTQDFEGDTDMYVFENSGGTIAPATSNEFRTVEYTDNSGKTNNAGNFCITTGSDVYKKVGYQFSEDGISNGKMYIKSKVRSETLNKNRTWGIFLLGDNVTSREWLALLGYDKGGTKPAKVADQGAQTVGTEPFKEGQWYSYEGTLDLDDRSMSVVLYDNAGALVGERSYKPTTARPTTGNAYYRDWPNGTPLFKSVSVCLGMELDDIEIYCDPIEALDTLGFVNEDGSADAGAGILTKQAQITFNHTASLVEPGAVKVDGVECTGALAADGKTYTFDLPTLVGNKEYTVTVDQTKVSLKDAVVDGKGNEKGVGEKTISFTTAGIVNYSEDFTNDVTAYNFTTSKGLGAAITDEAVFAQHDELGNRYARFYSGGGTWGRCGFEFSQNGVKDGQLKVQFRFRPYDKTFENFGSVLIGNCDAKFNWLSAVNVAADGTISTGYANNKNIPEDYALKDSDGGIAKAKQDTWYTYDAVMDLDTHSIDVKVIEDGTNAVYTAKLSDINSRGGKAEWLYWPDATNFKDIGCLFPMDLDDISISHMPLTAELSFRSKNGGQSDNCNLYTDSLVLNFNYPVTVAELEGRITVDGEVCSGVLSGNGRNYEFPVSGLVAGRTYTVEIPAGIAAINPEIKPTEAQAITFIPEVKRVYWSEDFDTIPVVKDFPTGIIDRGGVITEVNDENRFKVTDGYAQFNSNNIDTNGNQIWTRTGFEFDSEGVSGGQVRLAFKFSPVENQAGAVLIGNCDKKYNWLTALWVTAAGKLSAAYTNDIVRPVGTVAAGEWYTYEAIIDLDQKYMDIVVRDAENNEIGAWKSNIPDRMVDLNDGDWLNWPVETNFKQVSALLPINLDDIVVETYEKPVIVIENDIVRASAVADGDAGASYQLLLAQYDANGTLLGVDSRTFCPEKGEAALLKLETEVFAETDRFSAFLWDSVNGMKALETVRKQTNHKEYKVLAIGNSFCDDSIYYLSAVAAADDVVLMPTNCYFGGRPLNTHANRITSGYGDYSIKRPGVKSESTKSVWEALSLEDWDVVVLQAATHGSMYDGGLWTDREANWQTMQKGVSERAPGAKRIVHMSWAPYEEEAQKLNDANNMFEVSEGENARTAYCEAVIPHYNYGAQIYSTNAGEMIPTAIAVEYALTHFDGYFTETEGEPAVDANGGKAYPNYEGTHGMYRDSTCHLTITGRILASLVWYETVTGNSALDNKYVGNGLTEEDMQKLREAAHYACEVYRSYSAQ